MSTILKTRYLLLIALLLLVNTAVAKSDSQKLFVNLTSDEINRAAMALNFSTRVLKQKQIPVTVFLNVEAVRLLDQKRSMHTHASGKTLGEMLTEFIEAGGKVIVCPMCLKYVGGMNQADLPKGVLIGGPEVTWSALFAENTTVMSY